MAQYTLIDPATGQQTTLSEAELTRNLQLNCILLRDGENIGIITHRDLVIFIRWCAGEMLKLLVDEPDLKVTHALSLVDRWLEDERSLSNEELKDAAGAARRAAWAAADVAAWVAADAVARAARAARTADVAARAAWAASDVARATAHAAWAARATWVVSYEAQAQWLVEHLQSEK